MRYERGIHLVLVAALVAGSAALYKVVTTPDRDWVRVARDANYEVALDRASVTAVEVASHGRWVKAFEVWYRTDHALPRPHNGKTFTREVVRAIVQCDSLVFKVVSVDMSVGSGRTISRQRSSDDDLRRQRWRRVERGTTDEIAARAACHFGHPDANIVFADPPADLPR